MKYSNVYWASSSSYDHTLSPTGGHRVDTVYRDSGENGSSLNKDRFGLTIKEELKRQRK